MATVIRDLAVRLSLEAASFNNGLKAAQREAKEFEKTIKPTTTMLRDFGGAARTAGVAMTAAFTAPILAVTGIGIAFNAMEEQATVAFTTMLGSATKAQTFLSEMKDFAAKTPFEFPDLITASKRMMAYGFAAGEVKTVLTAVGNAGAALGGGAEAILRITTAMGQMRAKGTVQADEMRQLAEAGIPAWEILATHLGKTIPEAMKLVESRAVSAATGIEALTAGMTDKFGGMMEKQATTFSGLVSTIKDESRFLAGELTEGLFNALKGPAETLTKSLHGVRVEMEGWSDSTKGAVAGVALLVAAAGPAVFVFGTLAGNVSSMILLYAKLAPMVTAANTAFVAFTGFGIAAAAGVTTLGAALGVGIGMLANYALKLTGLEKVVDGFTKIAIHELWGELAATTDAAKSHEFTMAAVAKGWKAAAVDAGSLAVATTGWSEASKGLREQIAGLNPHLKTVSELTKEVSAMQADAKEKADDLAAADKKLADAAEDLATAQKNLNASFLAALKPADDLWVTLDKLNDTWSNADIVKVYGAEIIRAVDEQKKHLIAINAGTAALYAMAQAAAVVAGTTATISIPGLPAYANPTPDDKKDPYGGYDPLGLYAKHGASNSLSNIAAQPALPAALNLGGGGGAPSTTSQHWAGGFPGNGTFYWPEDRKPQGTSSFGGGVTVNSPVTVNVQRGSSVAEIQDELERGIGLEKMARTIFGAQNGIASTKGA